MDEKLPPLPPSDKQSMDRNRYDSFYDVKARDFWSHANIVTEELKDFEKCDHYFAYLKGNPTCQKCHVGYMGKFDIKNGKLFIGDQPLPI